MLRPSSKSFSGSMYSYSRRQTSSLALPHQPSQSPRYDQYEISGLDLFLKLLTDKKVALLPRAPCLDY